jgi:hypothetical protein
MSRADRPHGRRTALRALSAVAAAALLFCPAAPAVGDEPSITAQALADHGVFLPFAPAPPRRVGLCVVDTGVNTNPDTEGVVSARLAIDGGTPNDVSPSVHGTVLAMLAGAPLNGWGTVGVAPNAIQIVSVRILEPGQSGFSFNAYAAGMNACLQLAPTYNIRVINLSLGTSEVPSSQQYEQVANALTKASSYGVAVVSAAGNDDGGLVQYPAAYPGVLAVGATDTQDGSLCRFSNRGAGMALTAPGCDLSAADPTSGASDYNYWQGTSEASVIASAALGALYAYEPGLSPQAGEEDLMGAAAGALDIVQAFRRAGLAQLVAQGEAGEPPLPAASVALPSISTRNTDRVSAPSVLPTSAPVRKLPPLPAPLARVKRLGRRMLLLIENRPAGSSAELRYLAHRGGSRRLSVLRGLRSSSSKLALPDDVRVIELRFIDPYDIARASAWRTVALPASPRQLSRRHRQ